MAKGRRSDLHVALRPARCRRLELLAPMPERGPRERAAVACWFLSETSADAGLRAACCAALAPPVPVKPYAARTYRRAFRRCAARIDALLHMRRIFRLELFTSSHFTLPLSPALLQILFLGAPSGRGFSGMPEPHAVLVRSLASARHRFRRIAASRSARTSSRGEPYSAAASLS